MSYIKRQLKKRTDLTEKQIMDVVHVLIKSGYFNNTIEYRFNAVEHLIEARKDCEERGLPYKVAYQETAEHFRMSVSHLKLLYREFRDVVLLL